MKNPKDRDEKTSPVKTLQRSVFLIKPHLWDEEKRILKNIITSRGLPIVAEKEVLMTMPRIQKLYGHVKKEFMEHITRQMFGQNCFVAIVEAVDAIQRLVEVCGRDSAPYKCHPLSIRFLFGDLNPGYEHRNGIHRPTNWEELVKNLDELGFAQHAERERLQLN